MKRRSNGFSFGGLFEEDYGKPAALFFASKIKRGFVYFLRSEGGPVKIGYSESPARRVEVLRAANAHPLELLGLFAANEADEALLHSTFEREHIHHEWFEPSKRILAFAALGVTDLPAKDKRSTVRLRIVRHEGRIQVVDRDYGTSYFIANTVDDAQTFMRDFNG